MNNAAVISGSLVDAKNVNTHKVMRLIIDVPAENAGAKCLVTGIPPRVSFDDLAVRRWDLLKFRKVLLEGRNANAPRA